MGVGGGAVPLHARAGGGSVAVTISARRARRQREGRSVAGSSRDQGPGREQEHLRVAGGALAA